MYSESLFNTLSNKEKKKKKLKKLKKIPSEKTNVTKNALFFPFASSNSLYF